jgi:hypothetical protein
MRNILLGIYQRMKSQIRMITGIGMPISQSSNERPMMFLLFDFAVPER